MHRLLILTFSSALILGCTKQEPDPAPKAANSSDSTLVVTASKPSAKPLPPKPLEEMNRQERDAYKEELNKAGFYDCCVKPACNMCLYEAEECPCAELVKKGDGVCGECHKGWQKGKGAVQGVDPKTIKRM